MRAVFIMVLASLAAAPAIAAEWRLAELDPFDYPFEILAEGRPAAPDGLPDGRISRWPGHDLRRAWYAEPTTRYGHAVLGDGVEAGALVVERRDGDRLTVRLPQNEVFEDITPRLVDLDFDGRTEVVTILASDRAGAAVAVFGLINGELREIARTPHIGRSHRWLNIAGIAGYLGDGRLQIAYVETPHIGGVLRLLAFNGGSLREIDQVYGFSNHAIGSRELRLSATADVDGDGVLDLALPSADRRSLRLMTAKSGGWREIARLQTPSRIDKAIKTEGEAGAARFVLGLADGRVFAATRE